MISYPRNINALYVRYDADLGQVLDAGVPYPRADGQPLQGADPDVIFLEIVQQAPPTYSQWTEKLRRVDQVDLVNGLYVKGWVKEARDQAEAQAAHAGRTKQIAMGKILAIAPEWKQRNLTARSLELVEKQLGGEPLTAAEAAELTAIKAVWAQIRAIREASDTIEGDLSKDPDTAEEWPV